MEPVVRVAVDAMGGDFAPDNEIAGTLLAAKEKPRALHIILSGKTEVINKHLKGASLPQNVSIVNADEVITMEDAPAETFRTKPNSSLSVALQLLKDKKADAVISAGNTGAVLTNSTLKLGRIKGVGRPCIGSEFPTTDSFCMLYDVGASVDCKPKHLVEFAVMGSVYMEYVYNRKNPKVGLLSVGEEREKGNELTLEAYGLLEKANINFIGNVEGRDILKGTADIIVCDGFEGNIILKFAESVLDFLKVKFKNYAEKSFINKAKVGIAKGSLKQILSQFDYEQYGGVPLLGVNGVSIIGHGKSTPLAIKNMIYKAEEFVRKDVNKAIESRFSA